MPTKLEVIYKKQKITRPCRKAAKDLLQVIDYIEDGRKANAAYNLSQAIDRLQKVLRGIQKL